MESHIGQQLNKSWHKKLVLNTSLYIFGLFFRGGVVVSLPDSVVNTWSRSSTLSSLSSRPRLREPTQRGTVFHIGKVKFFSLCVFEHVCRLLTAVTLWLMIAWAMSTNHTVALPGLLFRIVHFAILKRFNLNACESRPLSWWSASVYRAAFSKWCDVWAKVITLCVRSVSWFKLLVLPWGGLCSSGLCVKWLLDTVAFTRKFHLAGHAVNSYPADFSMI